MKSETLCSIYKLFQNNNIKIWIDGGWGIDALLKEQTRDHSDLDIVVQEKDVQIALEILEIKGYKNLKKEDSTDWNFVYSNGESNIDFHVVNFDSKGNGIYGPPENEIYYPHYAFGSIGYINNLKVNCISPNYQLESHSGYTLRHKDYFDIMNLCNKFNLTGVSLMQEVYFAGGCLWGVQEYIRNLPGVLLTEAGRANGNTDSLDSEYDGYAECVKTIFDPGKVTLEKLMEYFFEIIDPYSINKQGNDVGEKYRTGVYSKKPNHLKIAKSFIENRDDSGKVVVEVMPLIQYVKSADEHQDRLTRYPNDYCHIPKELLHKYKKLQFK